MNKLKFSYAGVNLHWYMEDLWVAAWGGEEGGWCDTALPEKKFHSAQEAMDSAIRRLGGDPTNFPKIPGHAWGRVTCPGRVVLSLHETLQEAHMAQVPGDHCYYPFPVSLAFAPGDVLP